MAYVKHVRSNVKNGVDQELGRFTVIYGPGATGKSSITQSVELAVGGFASDIAGRAVVKSEAELGSLTNSDTLKSEAQLDTSAWYSYETTAGKRAVKKVPLDQMDFPLVQVRDALSGSAETARKFFAGFAAENTSVVELFSRVTAEKKVADYAENAINATKAPIADAINTVIRATKEKIRDQKSKIEGMTQAVTQVSSALPRMVTPDEVANLRTQVQRIDLEIISARRNNATVEAATAERERMRGEIHRYEVQLEVLENKVAEYEPQLNDAEALVASLPETNRDLASLFGDGLNVAKRAQHMELDYCPTCTQGANDWPTAIAEIEAAVSDVGDRVKAEFNLDRIKVEISDTFERIDGVEKHLTELRARGVSAAGTLIDVAPIERRLADAQQLLAEALGAQAAWQATQTVAGNVEEEKAALVFFESVLTLLTTSLNLMLDVGIESFCSRVSSYLPKGETFGIVMRDEATGRETFRAGLLSPTKTLRTALSGQEWARVQIALALACAKTDNPIIIPEDRAWDADTLAQVLKAIPESTPGQVIIATTVKPAGRSPAHWTLIETTKKKED